jgi:hypothetical protein
MVIPGLNPLDDQLDGTFIFGGLPGGIDLQQVGGVELIQELGDQAFDDYQVSLTGRLRIADGTG